MTVADLAVLSPYLVLVVASLVIMVIIAFYRNHALTVVLTLTGLALPGICIAMVLNLLPRRVTPLLIIDGYACFYLGLILLAGFAVAAMSYSYLEKQDGHHEEFYLLLILAVLGCAVLAAATHFVSFFLGIEILSVSLYALAAYLRHSDRSVEAGIKYLILAAVSSAFILFGMALVYAQTGSLAFSEIAAHAATTGVSTLPFLAGGIMIITGLGFKLAVVPFHLWTPDVYEGAPAPVTAFIATASKGAVFALLLRYFTIVDIHAHRELVVVITVIAVASMFAGNLLALFQTNVKRVLAYSSISHLGYLLVTVLASGPLARVAAAFYLTAYFITTLGAFGVLVALEREKQLPQTLDTLSGLSTRRPGLAALMAIFMFSLTGVPPFIGFAAKFYIIQSAVTTELYVLAVIMVVNSAISAYYYLRILVVMYMQPGERLTITDPTLPLGTYVVNVVMAAAVLIIGIFPETVMPLLGEVFDKGMFYFPLAK